MAAVLDLRVAPLSKISYFLCVHLCSHVYRYNYNQNHIEQLCFNNLKQRRRIRLGRIGFVDRILSSSQLYPIVHQDLTSLFLHIDLQYDYTSLEF